MSREADPVLRILYRGTETLDDYFYERMQPSMPILALLSPADIEALHKLVTSPRYSGNTKARTEIMDNIMRSRGFKKFAGGTNRVVYEHPAAPGLVFKVAVDNTGIKDSPAEFYNQRFLKPYCCKVFECTPCGTVASFEKVDRFTTFEEFETVLNTYYKILYVKILGKFVMEDIGINFFQNYGTRVGFGPVILDFPYLYELDGNKLTCKAELDDGSICNGEIDYTNGFNYLHCTKCGRLYQARELALHPDNSKILYRARGAAQMRVNIVNATDGKVVKYVDIGESRDFLSKDSITSVRSSKKREPMKVNIIRKPIEVKKEETSVEPVNTHHENIIIPMEKPIVTPTPIKTVATRFINVTIGKANSNKPKETEKKHTINVNLVYKNTNEVKPQNTRNNTIEQKKSIDTQTKSIEASKAETTSPEAPIVKRVINVSLGKSPINKSQVIITDKEDHKINVTLHPIKEDIKNVEEYPNKKYDPVEFHKILERVSGNNDYIERNKKRKEAFMESVHNRAEQYDKTGSPYFEGEEIPKSALPENLFPEEKVVEDNPAMPIHPQFEIKMEDEVKEITEDEINDILNSTTELPKIDDEIKEEEEETSVEVVEEQPELDYELIPIHYRKAIPEDLTNFEGEIIAIPYKEDDANLDKDDVVDPHHFDLSNYDNLYVQNGEVFLITRFNEDEEIIEITNYYDTESEEDAYVATDSVSEETSTSEEVLSSDDDEIARILKSGSKPSVSDIMR